MMEWLKNKECSCDEMTFASAALEGNLEGMMWLRLNGCPWDGNTFTFAAEHGNIELLRWLKENDYPMPDVIDADDGLEDETIVQWFDTRRCIC